MSVRVALFGAGVVGANVARLITDQSADLANRVGEPLELIGVAVRDVNKPRDGVPAALITDDPKSLLDQKPDVVVEVMGGIEPAKSLLLQAMSQGASVVTANKELLAKDGAQLHDAAAENEVDLYFEASVAGAIPLLRPLRESLVGDRIDRVMGIVNGSTNFILTKMDEGSASFDEAFEIAKGLGYIEADPSADIEGRDAAAKAVILAQLAFHSRVNLDNVEVEGITNVTSADVQAAKDMGFVIKLLAVAERKGDEGILVRVHPAMLPRSHPLASVRDSFNAVFVEAQAAGELMFYGQGAGGAPTASAVVGDLVAVARNKVAGRRGVGESIYAELPTLPADQAETRYLIRLQVADKP
ncbi:MAG: homoserine dehydrogenase, partial [Actinobacteria bacterium]|nr:homoserine dehydrogenase [Actinomycetota bacterium]